MRYSTTPQAKEYIDKELIKHFTNHQNLYQQFHNQMVKHFPTSDLEKLARQWLTYTQFQEQYKLDFYNVIYNIYPHAVWSKWSNNKIVYTAICLFAKAIYRNYKRLELTK